MLIQTIIATIGIAGSIIAASLSYLFTKKHKLEVEERRLKEEFYIKYMEALNDAANGKGKSNSSYLYAKAYNNLLLVASDDVVKLLVEYYGWTTNGNGIDKSTDQWGKKHDEILTKLLNEMRRDLFKSKSSIVNIRLMGSN